MVTPAKMGQTLQSLLLSVVNNDEAKSILQEEYGLSAFR
jgi:hypothetical protein